MPHTRHESRLEITRLDGDDLCIICTLTMPPEKALEAQRHPQPSLVMDPSRPTCVGWRLDTSPDAWSEVGQNPSDRPSTSRPDGVRIRFSYALESTAEVAAFFPPDGSAYVAKVEIDRQARTAWFPLPVGQSIHSLERPLGFDGRSLDYLIADWFYERNDRSPLPFRVDDASYYDDEGFYMNCSSKSTDTLHRVEIPEELLRDPIRNGSVYLEYGFNPWNRAQKAPIVAHLELELARLTEFFRRDASLTLSGAPAPGA